MVKDVKLQVLFEEDKAENNVTAYIPALRLGVKGDTLEEAREYAKDLIEMEFLSAHQKGRAIPKDNAIIETVTVSVTLNQ